MPRPVALSIRLPDPVPQVPLPGSARVLFLGTWVPLLCVETVEKEIPQLETIFGAEAIRPLDALQLELAKGIDSCLTEAERLLAAAPNGFAGRGGPKRWEEWSGYPAYDEKNDRIVSADGLVYDTPRCHMVAINVSKHDDPSLPFDPAEPVAAATEVAAGQVVVVIASGNEGDRQDVATTLSPWARAPWVLPVGATEDEEGAVVAAYSGRDAATGSPPIVAWGASGRDHEVIGTSFAAPRVTNEILVLAACLHSLAHAFSLAAGDRAVRGIPLVGEGMIDVGRPGWRRGQLAIPAYPLVGVDLDAVGEVAEALGERAASVSARPEPQRLSRALLRSARSLGPGGPGFVSGTTTHDYLRRFDGHELIAVAGAEAAAGDDRLSRPLMLATQLEKAVSIWEQGALHLYYEHETGEITLN